MHRNHVGEQFEVIENELERYLEDFERAHHEPGHADLSEFLPSAEHPQFQQIAIELIRCDMELSGQNLRHLRLDDYLGNYARIFENLQNLDQVAFEEFRLRFLSAARPG